MNVQSNMALRMPGVTNEDLAAMAEVAAHTLPDYIEETPVVGFTQSLGDGSLRTVYVKDETQQPGRSFKDRGAACAVGQYAELGVEAVLTASAGNHGMGLARAAQYYGLKATVVVPKSTEDVKKVAVTALGAELIEVEGDFNDVEGFARQLAEERQSQFVHPFADPYVIAGQGSVAVELLGQLPTLTQAYVPVGGSGLLAGFGSVLKQLRPEARIISSQVSTANTFTQSVSAGRLIDSESVDVRFGGLAVRTLDLCTFELAKRVTNACVQVCPDEVFRTVYEYRNATGVLLEPAGAVGLAAALAMRASCSSNEVVATVLTGANASSATGGYLDELAVKYGWDEQFGLDRKT